MKYNTDSGQSYNIPKYEILRTQMLAHRNEKLTLRELRNLTGLKPNTIKNHLVAAIRLGYVKQFRIPLGSTVLIRGVLRNRYRNDATYQIINNKSWYGLHKTKTKFTSEKPQALQTSYTYSTSLNNHLNTSNKSRA